jgi:hypothetical protein
MALRPRKKKTTKKMRMGGVVKKQRGGVIKKQRGGVVKKKK